MALEKGLNSYLTTAEAEEIMASKLDVAAWNSATEAMREQALITATSVLDSYHWIGRVVNSSQSLSFPRIGTYFDPRLGYIANLPSVVPDRILRATAEVAYHLLNNDGLLDDTGSVSSITVGSIVLSNIRSPSKMPGHVYASVKPLLNSANKAWWRAN